MQQNHNAEEIIISIKYANRIGFFSFIFLSVFSYITYVIFWGNTVFFNGINNFIFKLHITIPILIASIIVHELLHVIPFIIFGKTGFKAIKAGFKLKYGIPYVHCEKPVKSWLYKLSLLLPFTILGLIPLTFSFFSGESWFLIFGIIFTTAAIGDILVFKRIWKFNNSALILDHDKEPGCFLIER